MQDISVCIRSGFIPTTYMTAALCWRMLLKHKLPFACSNQRTNSRIGTIIYTWSLYLWSLDIMYLANWHFFFQKLEINSFVLEIENDMSKLDCRYEHITVDKHNSGVVRLLVPLPISHVDTIVFSERVLSWHSLKWSGEYLSPVLNCPVQS
jgi:hypothetical protein